MGLSIVPCRVNRFALAAAIPIGALANLYVFLSGAGRPDNDDDAAVATVDVDDDADLQHRADVGDDADLEISYGVPSFVRIQADLPSLVYGNLFCGHGDGNDDDGRGAACAVCLSEIGPAEEVRWTPCCCHAFHTPCIDAWIRRHHQTCPLCRSLLTPDAQEEEEEEEMHAIDSLQ